MNVMLESREELMDRLKTLGAQAMPGGGTATVLVVDDSVTNRKSLTRLLGHAGHQVLQAINGEEALTVLETERPDVIISDVLMPRMDGYEFARRVRANPLIAALPIIFYSAGYNQEEARSLAQSCGVFHILSKPAKPEEMLRTINAALHEISSPAAAAAGEDFDEAHRRLLTDKLSEKVSELQAALAKSRQNEVRLLQAMEKTVAAERAVEQSNAVLVRQNQEIQSFYHTVSHELKTPLTSAREFISIVLDGLAGPLEETQREYLNIAKESCNRLGVSINDLMDATRLETGKLTLEMKPGSLGALVREVVTAMGPVAARKQISLRGEVQPGPPIFPFDKNRMMQVLQNLVNNALKFTPEGGSITVTAGDALEQPGFSKICVKDSGQGIPAADLDRIFERLYQVRTAQEETQQGVGLGLYICRELVESHDGKIWVESVVGQGSTFCFIIPKTRRCEGTHVLVVDDDPLATQLLEQTLGRADFQVTTANNGQAALEQMAQQLPDIVIMDLEMPVKDGPQTLEEIRHRWGFLPVIILTGHVDEAIVARAMRFSPFTLLGKPCPTEQLVGTVRALCRK